MTTSLLHVRSRPRSATVHAGPVYRTSHHPPRASRRALLAGTIGVGLGGLTGGLTACGGDDADTERLQMIIPNSPGGGYDLTGRAAVKAMEDGGLSRYVEITNVLGGSGTVALQRLVNSRGATDLLMTLGLGVVGAVHAQRTDVQVSDLTPIARVVEEQEGLLVPADSPLRTVDDLVTAWTDDAGSISIGGGSSTGGPDHLITMQLAQAVDVRPADVDYRTYDGGGPLITGLLSNEIDVGVSGLGEFGGQLADGSLRVLAVSGADPVGTVDAPTLTAAGIDVVFTNWRAIVAPPGIGADDAALLTDLLVAMHDTTEWREALARNGWIDNFATGEVLVDFLQAQDARVADTLAQLGLA